MRRLAIVCSFVAAAFLVAAPLTTTPAAAAPSDKCVKDSQGKLRCSFDGDKVEAGLVTHDGKYIGGKIPPIFDTLIEYRLSFTDEFDKLVQAL